MRSRHLVFAAVSLVALAAADPARADCSTSTAGGVTTLTCGTTVTTNATNTNENSPSTTARAHRYPSTINATIAAGATISGLGLLIWPTGGNPLTVTNNGTVSHTAGETANGQPVHGLEIIGNGGLVTYLGNGSATTNATPPGLAAGLSIGNTNGGGINIGAAATPITGTFSGESAFLARAPSGSFINAWFHGGTFISTNTANDALELNGLGNVTLNITGQSVLTGSLNVGVYSNAPDASVVSVTSNAQITETLGPAVLMSGVSGGTLFSLTSGGAISGQAAGISMFSEGGEMRLTTAAGTTINATGAAGIGAQLQPDAGTGTIVADLSGSVTSGGAGLFLTPANGTVNVTIQQGGSVSGNEIGVNLLRLAGRTGVVDILNLGMISSPNTAADFDGTLRIGNGGTSGTISGNIVNRGSLVFNRSDASTYGGGVSGIGTLTKQGGGTLTLTGANTYTGATTVSAGTLLVNGSLISAITVASGARLGGTGNVGNVNINGELAPGGNGAIGTFTINGNLVFAAGSNFIVDVGPGTADRLLVTGTASLAGRLTALATGSFFTAGSYTLLTANGGISGVFSPLTTQPSGPVGLRYDANNVYLEVAQGTTSSSSFEATLVFAPNVTTVRSTAYSTRIIGRLVGGAPLYDQVFGVAFADPAAQAGVLAARAAITTAGGPGVIVSAPTLTNRTVSTATVQGPATYSVAADNSVIEVRETIGPATIQIGDRSGCAAALATLPSGTRPVCAPNAQPYVIPGESNNFDLVIAGTYTIAETRTDTVTETIAETWELTGQVATVGMIHAEVQSGVLDLGGRLLGRLAAVRGGNEGWAEAYRFRVSQSGRRDAWGLAGGFGVAVAPRVTLALGIDKGRLDIAVPGALERGEVELTEIGAALNYAGGAFTASLAAVRGFGEARTERSIIGVSAADYDVGVTGLALNVGYAIDAGAWTLRPVAALDYVRLSSDGFTESGALGLVAADQDADRVRASGGVEIGRDFGGFSLGASARYLTVVDGDERALPVAFAVAPARMLAMTAPNEPDGALLGLRAGIPLAPRAALTLGYDGRFGSGYEGHAGFVKVTVGL